MKVLSLLLPWLLSYRRRLAAGACWLLATNLLGMALPWLLKSGIDAVSSTAAPRLLWLAGLMGLAALLRALTRIRSRLCFLQSARYLEVDLRRSLLARLLRQPRSFFDAHPTGDLLSRFSNDLSNVRMLAGFGVMTICNAAFAYLLTGIFLLLLSPRLTLVAILPYPFLLLAVKRLSRNLHHHSARVQEGLAEVSTVVEEGVSGYQVVRACAWEDLRLAAFSRVNREYLHRNLALARLRALVLPVMTVVAPIGTLLAFFFGGRLVVGDQLSLGDLVAFNAYLVQLSLPTLMLGWILTLLQRASASMDRLQPLLHLPDPAPGLPAPLGRPPRLELRNLSFGFRQAPVLRDISLQIPAGEVLGLAGPTGSGKSALVKLLAGLYPVPAGMVFCDGVDLQQIDMESHRRRLAVVPQEGRLFAGSLAENLLFGCPDAPGEKLAEVGTLVQLQPEEEGLPGAWQARIGEGGLTLSGGQRQRVAIGRALARGGTLWLLDDPFSHLDAATARAVWQGLRSCLKGKTVILTSSRVSLLTGVDRVAVLEEGHLVQLGEPARLAAEPGLFARLLQQERLEDELEALA